MTSAAELAIPDHEPLRLIGRGGYGEVWLARNALGTLRAVKIVRRASFDSDRPFLREFTGIQKFEPISRSHEGLVDILQVGQNPAAGFLYYVMELADDASSSDSAIRSPGEAGYEPRTLASDLASRGPMPVAKAVHLFANLAGAVGHLHSHGLLHRDIKPANVIYVGGAPKLADIGLVAEAGGSRTFVGTEGFIPPEGPGTVAADLYALGKLMYEVATGRDRNDFPSLTFDRENPGRNGPLLELNAVLLRCCDPDPANRYPSATALQADLVLLQSGQSVQRLRANERRLRRARQIGALAALAALVAVAGVFLARRQERMAREDLRTSEILRRRAERAEQDADERLFSTLLARAAAERRSGLAGARANALAALRQASELHAPTAEMRSEVIAALALPDVSSNRRWRSEASAAGAAGLSPDGRLVALVQTNGHVRVTRTADDSTVQDLHLPGVKPLRVGPWSADGRWLAIASSDSTNRVWRLDPPSVIMVIPPSPVSAVFQFLADPPALAVLQHDMLRITSLESGESRSLAAPAGARRMDVSADGRLAAFGWLTNDVIEVRDTADGRSVGQITLSDHGAAYSLKWSSDGARLAAGTSTRRVEVWRRTATNFVQEHSFKGHGAEVVGVSWAPGGDLILSSGWDSVARVWGLVEGRELLRSPTAFGGFEFSGDGRRLTMFDFTSNEAVLAEVLHGDYCRLLAEPGSENRKTPSGVHFTPDSQWIATVTYDGIRAYRAADGRPAGVRGIRELFDLTFLPLPSHQYIAGGAGGRLMGEWGTNTAGELVFAEPHRVEPKDITTLRPEGPAWVDATSSEIRVFPHQGGSLALPGSGGASAIEVSMDGRFVAAALFDLRAALWRLGSPPVRFDLGAARNYGLAFSPDSRAIFFATRTELVRASTATGREEWRVHLTDSPSNNTSIKASADGRLVGVVMDRYTVSLVDAATGRFLAVLEPPDPQLINDIAISPDGHWLASACTTHVTQLWDLRLLRRELAALHLDW